MGSKTELPGIYTIQQPVFLGEPLIYFKCSSFIGWQS